MTLSSLTAAQVAALTPAITVGGVTIASPPSVSFAVSDGATTDNAIIGMGAASSGSLSYLRFALAKLVPGTSGSPSKWVSYIVTSTTAGAAQRPSTDNTGTLVDNKDGTYTYTFARDITKVKDEVAAMTLTAPNVAADLGDLTYDPSLTHRLTIQLSGGDFANPVNAIYDFIPATGKAVASTDTQRQVVSIDSCNQCHEKLAFHGSARIDTQYCVVCHTDQRKYGRENVASTTLAFPALTETATVNATTGITSYSYTPSTYVADGEVSGNFTTLIHKIHQGKELVKQNYHYAGVVFNNKGFSMLGGGQKMCSVCHDNTKAAQADNWNAAPSRLACGACHDGIKFSDGTGTTLGGLTTGHVGKAQSSDATCALCHAPADIKTYHQMENITKHNPTIAAGLKTIAYDIKSAAVNSTTNDVTIVFKVTVDGTAATFLAPAAAMANPLTGFTGAPTFLLAYASAATVDGITAPVDYNNDGMTLAQPRSISLANLLDTSKATTVGTLSATADSSGYYTATILGSGSATGCGSGTDKYPCYFPTGAKMRTVALQGYFTQVSPAAARHAVAAVKAVTGDTERRKVADPAKCSNCHEWLELHGGNRVVAPESPSLVCVVCHVPGLATSGRQAGDPDTTMTSFTIPTQIAADWKAKFGFDKTLPNAALKLPVTSNNFKDMIHGIHSGRDRVNPFVDARYFSRGGSQGVTLLDFSRMDFPGVLNNCETCHISGTYSGVPLNVLPSTHEIVDDAYDTAKTAGTETVAIAKTALATKTANATDRVTSPFAAACVSCHDKPSAQAHMKTQGGQIGARRNTSGLATGDACATCHGTGRSEDIAVVHKK